MNVKKYLVGIFVALVTCVALIAGCAGCSDYRLKSMEKERDDAKVKVAQLEKELEEAKPTLANIRKVESESIAEKKAIMEQNARLVKYIEEGPMKTHYEAQVRLLKESEEQSKKIKSLEEKIDRLAERKSADSKKVADAAESLLAAQKDFIEAEKARTSFLAKIFLTAIPSKRERDLVETQHDSMLSAANSKAVSVAEKHAQLMKVLGSQ